MGSDETILWRKEERWNREVGSGERRARITTSQLVI